MNRATVSVIIPVYDEEDNVMPLTEALLAALRDFPHPWEAVFVDDGSSDRTREKLNRALQAMPGFASLVELQRNFGQTAAIQAGIDQARGELLVTLDGDLQNGPADIPAMVHKLVDEDLDLVSGWRKDRQDAYFSRKLPSRIANSLIGRLTGVRLNDYGCTLKVYRGDVIRRFRIYGEMHRFLPALVAMHTKPSKIREHAVRHHPRRSGRSKYGVSRIWRVLLDLLSVYFFMSFRSRPAHFFGSIGLALALPGGLILGYLLYVRTILGEDIGDRPLLLAGIFLAIMSVQFFSTGILGEFMARIYHEATDTPAYTVRSRGSVSATAWKGGGAPNSDGTPDP